LLSINDKSKNTSQMKETFGDYIKELRNNNNLTLTQLAAKLDLDSANLSKIENGKRDFDEKRLVLLSDTFNIEIDEIKKEYYGDFIARKIYNSNCSEEILLLAEEKVKYLRSVHTKQTNLDL
jgi:transcriptional regulator with XRE-family HTH domain